MRASQQEHELEDWACARFAELNWVCLKFISPGFPGVPDRLLLTDFGRLVFIEFKRFGEKPKRRQPMVIKMLRSMGFTVELIDTRAQVVALINQLCRRPAS